MKCSIAINAIDFTFIGFCLCFMKTLAADLYMDIFSGVKEMELLSEYKFCCQVIRNYILDKTETFCFLRYRDQYLDHFEEVFASQKYFSVQLNKEHYRCSYLENVSTSNQFVCIFGVVAARIFLNVAKNNFL